jgi:mannitol/fructose-specific phosphotransferase system IIA component (Ntr-type)
MTAPYFQSGKWDKAQKERVIQACLKREELGSTGIGRGVAAPHTKHPDAYELAAFFACSNEGVDFSAVDGKPVHFFFFWVVPPNRPEEHLRFIDSISRPLRFLDGPRVTKMMSAKTGREIVEVLASLEREP